MNGKWTFRPAVITYLDDDDVMVERYVEESS